MTRFLIPLAAVLLVGASYASAEPTIISERDVDLHVDISATNVKWSQADYSNPVVKILAPELADVTILDHRNTGEGAPCLASYSAPNPEAVIQDNPARETVKMHIVLQKEVVLHPEDTTCQVLLIENISGTIRGFPFKHQRDAFIGERHVDDCR